MTTLAQLVTGAQDLADFTADDDFVSPERWIAWVNEAVLELHRLIISSEPDSYYETADFTISSGNTYALPANFHAIRGLTFAPDTPIRETVHKYTFGDRNAGHGGMSPGFYRGEFTPRRYRVVKPSQLIIEPFESAAGNYRLIYTPKPTPLIGTRAFDIDAADTPAPSSFWSFANGNFTAADIGRVVVPVFDAPNELYNVAYTIISIGTSTTVEVTPTPDVGGFTGPAAGTCTVSDALDAALDDFAEYVMVATAIKAIAKEEGDTRALDERKAILRDDILRAFRNDDNEPDQIADVW